MTLTISSIACSHITGFNLGAQQVNSSNTVPSLNPFEYYEPRSLVEESRVQSEFWRGQHVLTATHPRQQTPQLKYAEELFASLQDNGIILLRDAIDLEQLHYLYDHYDSIYQSWFARGSGLEFEYRNSKSGIQKEISTYEPLTALEPRRPAFDTYFNKYRTLRQELRKIANRTLALLSLIHPRFRPEEYCAGSGRPCHSLGLLKYEPTLDNSHPELFALNGHFDPHRLTLILPATQPGLQIYQNEEWVDAYEPEHVMLIVGRDAYALPATKHRVAPWNSTHPRFSGVYTI